MKAKKFICVALAAVMLLGGAVTISSCSGKNKRKNAVVKADDPWFASTTVKIKDVIDTSGMSNFYGGTPTVVGDVIAYPAEYSIMTGEYMYENHSPVYLIDFDGNLIKEIDIPSDEESQSSIIYIGESNGKLELYVQVSKWTMTSSSTELKRAEYDVESGTLSELKNVDIPLTPDSYINNIYDCCGCLLILASSETGSNLIVMKDEKELSTIDLYKESNFSWAYIPLAPSEEDGKIKVNVGGEGGEDTFLIDPENGNYEKDGNSSNFYYYDNVKLKGEDGTTYVQKSDGIYTEDGDPYIQFCDSDANISLLSYARVLSFSEDRVVLQNDIYDPITYDANPVIVILDRQDENPNAGKTIIKAVATWAVQADAAEGISKFNKENDKYFIKTICTSADYSSAESSEDYDKIYEEYEKQFIMDFLSDDGPDIVFGADSLAGLLNEDHLIDLSKDLKLDPDLYYTNVIDACKDDEGKLFICPVSFSLQGIVTSKSIYTGDGNGFTLEQYKKFVDEGCNGSDPISDFYSREEYLQLIITSMSDIWIKDGKVDFDKDEFRELAAYVKDNVPERANLEADEGVIIVDESFNNVPARQSYIDSFSTYINESGYYDDPGFYGYPSIDGRGPILNPYSTVSISASSSLKDACLDFIKVLLSEDVQDESYSNPVLRASAEKIIDDTFKTASDNYNQMKTEFGISDAEMRDWGYSKPSATAKEDYLEILENVSVYPKFEGSVTDIIVEEARAYLSGQKDVEEFIKNSQNRVQTYLDEK